MAYIDATKRNFHRYYQAHLTDIFEGQHIVKSYLWVLAAACTLIAPIAIAANLQPTAIVKSGHCPNNYSSNGNYCAPNSSAYFALAKVGTCPNDYTTNGNDCLAAKNARHALPKVGSCPNNYVTSGAYCLSNK